MIERPARYGGTPGWGIGIVAGLVVRVALALAFLHVVGRNLPEGHEISAKPRPGKPPGEVWNAIADTAGIRSWDKGVDRAA